MPQTLASADTRADLALLGVRHDVAVRNADTIVCLQRAIADAVAAARNVLARNVLVRDPAGETISPDALDLAHRTLDALRDLDFDVAGSATAAAEVAGLAHRTAENAARGTLVRTSSHRSAAAVRALIVRTGGAAQSWTSYDAAWPFFYVDPADVPSVLAVKGVSLVVRPRDDLRRSR